MRQHEHQMGIQLRKSNKVREFKDSSETNIKEWLTRFDQEMNTLKRMAGIADDLRREEIVDLFKDRLKYLWSKGWIPHLQQNQPLGHGRLSLMTN